MTAYRYVRLGQLPARKVGGSWQVARADLHALRADDGTANDTGRGRGRQQPAPWAERLENRLRAGDELGSWGVVEAALGSGAEPSSVYVDVIGPAMRSIGEAWASGEIDVSVEHRASVIVMRLFGRLGPRFARPGRRRGDVVVGAPAGDHHGLPVAMFADLVRGAGFGVVDLGADVPAGALVVAAGEASSLIAVALTVTTPDNERVVTETVDTLHASLGAVPVLVGGGAVPDEATARTLGADGWAADGMGALVLLQGLVA